MTQGDVWWVRLLKPSGDRPVAVVQGNAFNRSRILTTVVVPLTRTVALAAAPGNVLLDAGTAGLEHDSVANVSQVFTIERARFERRVGQLSASQLAAVLKGIDTVLGR